MIAMVEAAPVTQFIVEFGSGNTCRNDRGEVERMIDAVAEVDSGVWDEVIFKWQLFHIVPPNIRLQQEIFDHAYHYAASIGYPTTASVFDPDSLAFLLGYDVPFVKIACRGSLYALIDECPVPVYVSVSHPAITFEDDDVTELCCVSQYPALLSEYERIFPDLSRVSDHTIGWDLLLKHSPVIIEKHVVHERRATNPDAGAFSVTPEELRGVL